MTKLLQRMAAPCIALAAIALAWIYRGEPVPSSRGDKRELNANGAVLAAGEGPSSFVNQYREAADLVAKGRVREAEALYRELALKEPDSPNAYVGLGSCLGQLKDTDGA